MHLPKIYLQHNIFYYFEAYEYINIILYLSQKKKNYIITLIYIKYKFNFI